MILSILRLNDSIAYHYLKPIAMSGCVQKLIVLRPKPASEKMRTIQNLEYHYISDKSFLIRFWVILTRALFIAKKPEVKMIVSFNPVPYGMLALFVGWMSGKPVHLGFVGTDWYLHGRSWYGRILDHFFKKANLITATGEGMKRDLLRRGYNSRCVHVLPHAVNVKHFFSSNIISSRTYDILFVGELIPRKRVDLIIKAVPFLKRKMFNCRLCIVGDGPLRQGLEKLSHDLGVHQAVEFVGYQSDPKPWMEQAKTILIVSEREGFPFVLVEGMCSGAVPVTVGVGTINDFIKEDENGFFLAMKDPFSIANKLIQLLSDVAKLQRVQESNLQAAARYDYDPVSELWREWLNNPPTNPKK